MAVATQERTWPVVGADLDQWEPAPLYGRSYESRMHTQNVAGGWSDDEVMLLLGCTYTELVALQHGAFDSHVGIDDRTCELPEVLLPAPARKLKQRYASFLAMCSELGPRPKVRPEPVKVTVAQEGTPDQRMTEWLRRSIQGYGNTFTRDTLPAPEKRTQLLASIGCSAATLAEVCGASEADVRSWMASDKASLDWNLTNPATNASGFTTWLTALRFLGSGVTYGNTGPTSKAARNGHTY